MSKKIVSLILAALTALTMTAFGEDAAITVTDMLGREITLKEPATRIVSLTPAECEILCALGCEDMLVGRGKYCDYPETILDLPALSASEELNVEEVLSLEPQIVLMSDMNLADEQVLILEDNGVKVVLSDTTNIEGVYTAIRMIGKLTGRDEEAEKMVLDMQDTFERISNLSEKSDKTIYFEVMPLEWGLWSAGKNTFMHELAEMVGMNNAFGDIDGWKAVSEEQVILRDPDYIVLVTGMGETAVDEVLSRAGWGDMKAIKNNAVYNADSNAITRPGPRLKDAAMDLYEFLYGEEIQK